MLLKHKLIHIILTGLFFILSIQLAISQELWTCGAAKTLVKGQFETGIIHPLKYGAGHRWELQIHPVAFLQIPNLGTKIHWRKTKRNYLIGSRHTLYYPTPMLRRLHSYDIYLSQNQDILPSPILVMRNELIISKLLKKKTSCTAPNYLTSLRLGLHIPLISDTLFAPVELPILFPRMHAYNDTVMWYVGLDSKIRISSGFQLATGITFQSVDWKIRHWGIEQQSLFIFQFNENLWFLGGYRFSWENSFSPRRYALYPVVDIIWRFRDLRKGKERTLFKKKMF